jgi:E3 ubiquitin-protein ligase SHPRH
LSLYTKDNAAGTLDVSSFELGNSQKVIDSPAKKKTQKGDFIFQYVTLDLIFTIA